jgi:uncharacterized LabA/DUF88 family protein
MIKTVIAFADGENLTCRYQEMLDSGRKPSPEVVLVRDSFVWVPALTQWTAMNLVRVLYYTSVVGDDTKVAEVSATIGQTRFRCVAGDMKGLATIIPRVHKKPSNSRKSKVVDIELTIDVMRAALTMPIDGIFLLSGDGDYLQLVREVTRSSKQIYVGAFSSGLSEALRHNAENFVDLDRLFFPE